MVFSHLPRTKEEAIITGSVCYYTGVPCKNGHDERRYTNTGICYGCKRRRNKVDTLNHPERISRTQKRTYQKHKATRLQDSQRWAQKNRTKSNAIKKSYKIRHREKYLKYCREYAKRIRRDPLKRLSKNTSKLVWDSLKHKKGGRHWEKIVGFSLEALMNHLESQFAPEMNWDNYCTYWELDHIKPLNLCRSFEEAWKLENLQPLKISVNRAKRDRYIG